MLVYSISERKPFVGSFSCSFCLTTAKTSLTSAACFCCYSLVPLVLSFSSPHSNREIRVTSSQSFTTCMLEPFCLSPSLFLKHVSSESERQKRQWEKELGATWQKDTEREEKACAARNNLMLGLSRIINSCLSPPRAFTLMRSAVTGLMLASSTASFVKRKCFLWGEKCSSSLYRLFSCRLFIFFLSPSFLSPARNDEMRWE